MSKKVFVAFSTKLQRYQLPGDGTYSRGTIWNCVCCLSSWKWKEGGRKEDQSQEELARAWLWPMVQECGAGKRCVNHCQTRQCHWTTGAPSGAWFSYGSSRLSLFGLGSSYIVGVSVAKGRDVVLRRSARVQSAVTGSHQAWEEEAIECWCHQVLDADVSWGRVLPTPPQCGAPRSETGKFAGGAFTELDPKVLWHRVARRNIPFLTPQKPLWS